MVDRVNVDGLVQIAAGADHDFGQISEQAIRLQGDDPEVGDAWLTYLRLRAISLVRRDWHAIEDVADALLKRKTLTTAEARDAYLESFRSRSTGIFGRGRDDG